MNELLEIQNLTNSKKKEKNWKILYLLTNWTNHLKSSLQKKFQKKHFQGKIASSKLYKNFKTERTLILYKLFQKIEKEWTLSSFFLEAKKTLIPKFDKSIMRKKNYSPISLTSICNLLNQLLANWIQCYIKRIIKHDQVGFTQTKVSFNI